MLIKWWGFAASGSLLGQPYYWPARQRHQKQGHFVHFKHIPLFVGNSPYRYTNLGVQCFDCIRSVSSHSTQMHGLSNYSLKPLVTLSCFFLFSQVYIYGMILINDISVVLMYFSATSQILQKKIILDRFRNVILSIQKRMLTAKNHYVPLWFVGLVLATSIYIHLVYFFHSQRYLTCATLRAFCTRLQWRNVLEIRH